MSPRAVVNYIDWLDADEIWKKRDPTLLEMYLEQLGHEVRKSLDLSEVALWELSMRERES